MSWWEALVLGLVQGLTEFLPVSSSGHLWLVGSMTGMEEPQTSFDLSLHVATLVAVTIVFRSELLDMVAAPFRSVRTVRRSGFRALWADSGFRGCVLVVVGCVPAGIAGILWGDNFEAAASSLYFLGFMFLANACILFMSRSVRLPLASRNRLNKGFLGLRLVDVVVIGLFQAVAILRGVSRSGSTISAALMMGVDRETAGRFSFLLGLPAILGAEVLSLLGHAGSREPGVGFELVVLGSAAAFGSGYLALRFLLGVVKSGRMYRFGWYSLALGTLILGWLQYGDQAMSKVVEIVDGIF